jgi:hypothetical protein
MQRLAFFEQECRYGKNAPLPFLWEGWQNEGY